MRGIIAALFALVLLCAGATADAGSLCTPFRLTATGAGGWLRQNPLFLQYTISVHKSAGTGSFTFEGKNGAGAATVLKTITGDDGQVVNGPWEYLRVNVSACTGCTFVGSYCGVCE